jgi:tetratricopeptide (TPR) repeat protein
MRAPATTGQPSRPPYVGLRAFRQEDQDRFYGRIHESHEIAALWRANKLTVLYGASGVGKTSLLQAGVIPLLDAESVDVLPVGRVSAGAPPVGIQARNPYTFTLLSTLAPDRSGGELADLSVLRFLRQRGLKRDRYGDPVPILLAIDQAEELFGDLSYRPDSVRRFISGLATALRNNRETRLLLTVREDRLPWVLSYERILAGRSHARFRLLPFGEPAALEAIRKPLKGTGRRFQAGVANELVRDLRTIKVTNELGETTSLVLDTVDPVQVQVVCSALWESLPSSARVITSAHVSRYGNIDRFLASFCSRTLSAVAREHEVPVARLRSWLQRTFITELGTRGTAYEGLGQTAGMPNSVVRSLEDKHLIKAEHRAGTRWYELQHDRLIEPLQQAHPLELLETAELELADGGLALAERHAEQAIRACSLDDLKVRARAERVIGSVAVQRHQADEALRRYRVAASLFEVLEDSSSVAQLLAEAGRLSIASRRYTEAVTDLRAAAERAPADLSVQYALANALWYVGQPLATISVLGGILEVDGTMVAALRLRGEILADLGKAAEALQDLNRVRRGQQPSTIAARALAHAASGLWEAADQEAADAEANASDSGPVLIRVAKVRILTGEPALAAELAAAALAAAGTPLPRHLRTEAERMLRELAAPAASQPESTLRTRR